MVFISQNQKYLYKKNDFYVSFKKMNSRKEYPKQKWKTVKAQYTVKLVLCDGKL